MKKEKKREKLNLDDLEIESFETKVAPVVVGGNSSMSILSCAPVSEFLPPDANPVPLLDPDGADEHLALRCLLDIIVDSEVSDTKLSGSEAGRSSTASSRVSTRR